MRHEIVARWAEMLSQKLGRSAVELSEKGLIGSDFLSDYVEIFFEDGSYCKFNYALVIINDINRELVVFTEHCGYYTFSSRGVSVYEYTDSIKTTLIEFD